MDSSYSSSPVLAMPAPLPFVSASTIAIPTLDTIPGSAEATPSIHEPKTPTKPPPLDEVETQDASFHTARSSGFLTPSDGPQSRRGSSTGAADSYFPLNIAGPSRRSSLAPSGTSTPGDRPRPAPIEIPVSTPESPLFSAYPNQSSALPTRNNSISKGKGKAIAFPPKPDFSLSHPTPRKKITQGGPTATPSPLSGRPKVGRRRASTISESPPLTAQQARKPVLKNAHVLLPDSFDRDTRRSSLPGQVERLGNSDYPHWPAMPIEEARRLRQNGRLPFSYQHPAQSDYTLQSVSTVATVRPLISSPHISPRRSSLTPLEPMPRAMHGLTPISNHEHDGSMNIVLPDDMVMPHGPPPRHSSLDTGGVRLDLKPKYQAEPEGAVVSADMGSVLSASLTGTDTSASAEFFSTSPSSKEHPLSSATTSLSRSAKSSKEGGASDEKDAALTAIRLQRSLEWEARQTRHRRRLEKRRMILLELVETEVGYTEDLKKLVHVYLPQLYALPSVSERTADLVARNAKDLLEIHLRLAIKMVEVLKEEHLGYEPGPEPVVSRQLERVSRRLAGLLVEEVSSFSAYNEYCAGSIAAATLVRHISERQDYSPYERRCQIISASQPHVTLQDMLAEDVDISATGTASVPSSPIASGGNRSRLHFRDFLIMPIQRVCRYPLLLSQLLNAATTPEEESAHPEYATEDVDGDYDTGVDVERALGAMRGVAEEADEARRLKENEIKSATVIERLEPHPALSPAFLKSLGMCRLIGSLDVLHHHPTVAPLVPPVKVKYMGAFLYKGYLILAKVRKGKLYEARHFLPLEVFELIDITEGFLPHSIRLSLRDHNFDLAASCETEKEVWASALCQARDESTVPPFELPASVSPFAARSRRMSAVLPPDYTVPLSPTLPSITSALSQQQQQSAAKRHTVAVSPDEIDFRTQPGGEEDVHTPATSPTQTSFGFTPDRAGRPGQPSTILLRRASTAQRLLVDRALIDVFSESCATARSKAQLHHTLFLPDLPTQMMRPNLSTRESGTLRRRRSFLDSKQSSTDIAFTGEIRGSVMPVRQTRSMAGKRRSHPGKRYSNGHESSTEVDRPAGQDSADDTATSDFGTLTKNSVTPYSRAQSSASISNSNNYSPAPPLSTRQSAPNSISALGLVKRKSLTNIRRSIDAASESTVNLANMFGTLNRRKTASTLTLNQRQPEANHRAKSVPASPVATPFSENPPPLPAFPAVPSRDLRRPLSQPGAAPGTGMYGTAAASEDQAVPIFSRGQGWTNQSPSAERDRPNLSAWSSLRRSMSFIRDTPRPDNSGHSASNSGSGDSVHGHGQKWASRPGMSRNSTDDGFDAGTSSNGHSDPMSNEDEGAVATQVTEKTARDAVFGNPNPNGAARPEEAVHTPRRRKSTRIFQTLSRFTPI